MIFTAATLWSLSLLVGENPPQAKPPAGEGVTIERQGLEDVIAVSKDGKVLALMDSATSNVVLYDPKTFKELRTLEVPAAPDLTQSFGGGRSAMLVFSPDSKLLIGMKARQFRVIPVWEVATGKLVGKLPAFEHQNDSFGFSPTGKEILGSGYEGADKPGKLLLKAWLTDLEKGQINPEPRRSLLLTGNLTDIALDPTGTRIYQHASEKGYEVVDATTGAVLEKVENKALGGEFFNSGYRCELSPDSKLLAIATGKSGTEVKGKREAGLLRVWDLEKKSLVLDLPQPSLARYAAFSPDGKLIAVSCPEACNLYEVSTGTLLRSIEGSFIRSFAFSPDSAWLFAGVRKGLRAWKVK